MSVAGPRPIRLAIAIRDRLLAERIADALAGLAAVEVVARDDVSADAVIGEVRQPGSADASEIALSAREIEVLALLSEGVSNKVIARRLGISVNTAKFHVAALLDKLDAASRTDAVARAIRKGMLDV